MSLTVTPPLKSASPVNVETPSTANVFTDKLFANNVPSVTVVIPEKVVTPTNFQSPETSN